MSKVANYGLIILTKIKVEREMFVQTILLIGSRMRKINGNRSKLKGFVVFQNMVRMFLS